MNITLSRPIKYKDAELTDLNLELEALTGRDLIDVEEGLKARGVNVAAWDFSRTFLIGVAARALHLPVDVLKDLSAGDFTRLVNEVLAFLGNAGSQDTTHEASER